MLISQRPGTAGADRHVLLLTIGGLSDVFVVLVVVVGFPVCLLYSSAECKGAIQPKATALIIIIIIIIIRSASVGQCLFSTSLSTIE